MDGVMAAARRHGLRVVEDAAQAHGAAWRGTPVGAIGDVGVVQLPVVQAGQRRRGRDDGHRRRRARRAPVVVPQRRPPARRRVVRARPARLEPADDGVPGGRPARADAADARRSRRSAPRRPPISTAALAAHPRRRPAPGPRRRHGAQLVHVPLALAGCRPTAGCRSRRSRAALRAEGIPVFAGYVPLNRNQAVIDEIARLGGPAAGRRVPNAERADGRRGHGVRACRS